MIGPEAKADLGFVGALDQDQGRPRFLGVICRMRALCLAILLVCNGRTALAETEWLPSARLAVAEIRVLCDRVSGVELLARQQMISTGNARWRWLSRQELVFETTVMGVPPLNPGSCYVIARAGQGERERRAFEVHDFIVNPKRTSVFIIGRDYDAPPEP